jgi:urea transporter
MGAAAGFSELAVGARVVCLVVASLLSGAVVVMPVPNAAQRQKKSSMLTKTFVLTSVWPKRSFWPSS